MKLPNTVFSGYWKEGHVQGIAVDVEKGYVYYSFTTILLKTDLLGNPVGSVRKLAGHLGCITFDPERRKVYGSLELKHDVIGAGIIARTGWDPNAGDNFYLVSFDADRIDRMDMDAEADCVMQAVWLADVGADYRDTDPVSGKPHRYGCSGCDGTGYGPVFGGDAGSPGKIMLAYGIYGDTEREDNDHQIILQYDPSVFDRFGQPLCQENPHHSGPERSEQRYFCYTGNTTYGIQNLEYDAFSRTWLVAVYTGKKGKFPNFPLFFIDAAVPAEEQALRGRGEERGGLLHLAQLGEEGMGGIFGSRFPLGATGIFSLGDGRFYFSRPMEKEADKTFASRLELYRMVPGSEALFHRETE